MVGFLALFPGLTAVACSRFQAVVADPGQVRYGAIRTPAESVLKHAVAFKHVPASVGVLRHLSHVASTQTLVYLWQPLRTRVCSPSSNRRPSWFQT